MKQDELPTEFIKARVEQLSTRDTDDKPIIVAYGLMNAGKSFLLNMLTQHIEEEFFKTNDIRETTEVKKFESGKYIYLDTPGLDANADDNAQAKFGASQADVVLFVHQPQGELEANEVKLLKELKQSFGNFAENNIILVLSKIEKEEPTKINLIEEKIRSQCTREIGFSPKVFQVSNKRYQMGLIKHKDVLIVESHVKPLIQHIDFVASSAKKVRAQRSLAESEALLQILNSKELLLKGMKTHMNGEINEAFSIFNNQINSLKKFLEDSASQYLKI